MYGRIKDFFFQLSFIKSLILYNLESSQRSYFSPIDIPLERVELSAWPRDGAWGSMTLSSNRCLGPAFGNVALLNSAVFILWMKLETKRNIFHIFYYCQVIQNIKDTLT